MLAIGERMGLTLPPCPPQHHLWDAPLLHVCATRLPPVHDDDDDDEDYSQLNKIFAVYVVLTILVMLVIKYLSQHSLVFLIIAGEYSTALRLGYCVDDGFPKTGLCTCTWLIYVSVDWVIYVSIAWVMYVFINYKNTVSYSHSVIFSCTEIQ